MKNKLLIIISLLFINMGVAYADNKLLDYFHEEDIEILLNSNLKGLTLFPVYPFHLILLNIT